MTVCIRNALNLLIREVKCSTRLPFSTCSSLMYNQRWRERKGLPANPNKERMLLDLPDFSYVDGRPTPYGTRQKLRIEKQRKYTERIIALTEEINIAEKLYSEKLAQKKAIAEERIKAKLTPKGDQRITI